jgi:hypothetical protein
VYFRLVKGGYASSVAEAATMDARTVVQVLLYEKFLQDYEQTYLELNKD